MARRSTIWPTPFADAPKTVAQISTLAMMSPMVIGTRMMNMWMSAASPSASDRAEAARMVSEKMLAAGESIVAMNMAAVQAATDATLAAATGRTRRVNDGDAIIAAGLKPYTKRVRANRKRLSR